MAKTILKAENLSKSFSGVPALKKVSVEIQEGRIMCLAGENGSGKSTLVKLMSGVYIPDEGTISIDGKSYDKLTPITAINEGIQVIFQDLSLFNHMSVAENIAMSKLVYEKRKLIHWNRIRETAAQQLDKIGVKMDIDKPIEDLSIANRQLVAICRALSLNARVLFMDEPTGALTQKEVDRLLSIVSDLKSRGMAIVFISHKLDEIFKVSDTITVFRDGCKVGDFDAAELNPKRLSYYMTGREIEYSRYIKKQQDTSNVLEVKNLCKQGMYQDINFTVNKGDILGITGLLGAGRTEIALSLFGLNPPDKGEILMEGKPVHIASPKDAMSAGIAMMPEDRQSEGLFMQQSMSTNIASTILGRLKNPVGVIDFKKQSEVATKTVNDMGVNNKNIDLPVKNLSGGNQQKVVLGKWMVTDPKLFILDTPTVGVDIGSKSEIYQKVHGFADQGMGVILISDEIEEIMANANKVLVMYKGKVIRYLDEQELQQPGSEAVISELLNNPEGKGKPVDKEAVRHDGAEK